MSTPIVSALPQSFEQQLAAAVQSNAGAYTPVSMLINMSLALALGMLLAGVYRHTHKGLSYSQSFTLTIVFVTTIVAITLMAIESSLARAFALVGALSIIRFRTVVKDTKDTAYVFAGLAVGMAAGTGRYVLAVMGAVFISVVALVLHKMNFGAASRNEFMVRFAFDQNHDNGKYLAVLSSYCKRSSALYAGAPGSGRVVTLTVDVSLKNMRDLNNFVTALATSDGVSDVTMVSSKSEVDY